jgi:hypothetical protein
MGRDEEGWGGMRRDEEGWGGMGMDGRDGEGWGKGEGRGNRGTGGPFHQENGEGGLEKERKKKNSPRSLEPGSKFLAFRQLLLFDGLELGATVNAAGAPLLFANEAELVIAAAERVRMREREGRGGRKGGRGGRRRGRKGEEGKI